MPFEELSHTADLCLHVWAVNLLDLFLDAAKGMYSQAGIRFMEEPQVMRIFSASAPDVESLLVSFLSELIYYVEQDHLGFVNIELKIDHDDAQSFQLYASLCGAPLLALEKSIKAVTFHNLQIQQTHRGVEVTIVFDV
jgi:SHS2 domain-containing protein